MLANMLGHVQDVSTTGFGRVVYQFPDKHPFDGEGMRLRWNSGTLTIDDYLISDPTAPIRVTGFNLAAGTGTRVNTLTGATASAIVAGDTEYHPLSLNVSPAAHDWRTADPRLLRRGGVGYNAPDINTIFLAHRGYITNPSDPTSVIPVVIPSYHRPQHMRRPGANDPLSVADPAGQRWFDRTGWGGRILRPHPEHKVQVAGFPAVSRFLSTSEAASTSLNPLMTQGFPFQPMDENYTSSLPQFKAGKQGIWERIAATSPTFATDAATYEYDSDNDLDGVREGIWMDLGYPVQKDADGTPFVPLFSATIYDLDGLINLNAHGNLAANQHKGVPVFVRPVGQDGGSLRFLSRSSQGLGSAEVNPSWALNARPGVDTVAGYTFKPYQELYGSAPSAGTGADQMSSSVWKETSNMEVAMLLLGQVRYSSPGIIETIIAGRYGEESLLQAAIANPAVNPMPRAGVTNPDDNVDVNGLEFPHYPALPSLASRRNRFPSTSFATLNNSRMGWPLALGGIGSDLNPSDPKQLNRSAATLNHLTFTEMALNYGAMADPVRWLPVNAPRLGSLFGLVDDPYEQSFFRGIQDTSDSPFSPMDSAVLQMREAAANDFSLTSQVALLAPFNMSATNNVRGDSIRQKFSTISSDRASYSWPRSANRPWEYSDIPNVASRQVFPPFRVIAPSTIIDPLRPALRNWISACDGGDYKFLQRRLSINGVVDSLDVSGADPFARPLTPHHDLYTSANRPPVLPDYYSPYANPASPQPAEVEAMARRDRQLMARDIYTLLYVLGGPWNVNEYNASKFPSLPATFPTNWSVLTTTPSDLYSEDQLREMAQFAVNVVDSLDRDDIITRFVYDKDLSDGWQVVDENPDDFSGPLGTPGNPQFAEVFGVERAQLAINEVLGIFAEKVEVAGTPTDLPLSEWDDEEDHYFLYTELKNTSPFPSKISKGSWKIEVVPDPAVPTPTTLRQFIPHDPSLADVPAGGAVVFGGASDLPIASTPAVGAPSVMKADFRNQGASPDFIANADFWLAPRTANTSVNPLTFDLLERAATNGTTTHHLVVGNDDYAVTDPATRFIQGDMFTGAPSQLTVRLYRRQYPERDRPIDIARDRDNRWVLVDEAKNVSIQRLSLQQGDSYPDLDGKFARLTSSERPEPLNRTMSDFDPSGPGVPTLPADPIATDPNPENPYANSLGLTPFNGRYNSTETSVWTAWQKHFDRDFSSPIELFEIPLFGNELMTRLLVDCTKDYVTQNSEVSYDADRDGVEDDYTFTRTAGAKFVHPTYPPAAVIATMPTFNPENLNRWHRVLELLEVPSRINRNLVHEFDTNAFPRVAGKINWNTIRNSEVLAALIDDDRVIDLATSNVLATNPPGTVEQPAVISSDGENLWVQLLKSRDGSLTDPWYGPAAVGDPYSLGCLLPGLPGSQPFTGHAGEAILSDGSGVASSTIRRWQSATAPSIPGAPVAITDRLAFEVGNETEHANGDLDPMIRHRLIAKMSQNGTTRSNTFVVFLTCKFFRATYDTANGNAVRIGGPLNDLYEPEYRGVYVVDRTKLEAGYDANQGTFDFRKFIEAGQVLEK
jgi:hypothetical protein